MKLSNWSLFLIFLSGIGFALPHAPFNFPLASLFAIGIAVPCARETPHKYWAGYLFGLGFFVPTMSWISEPFAVGPPEYAWMAYPAWALMAGGLALFWIPIFRFMNYGLWTIALIFGFMEYLRGHIFTGLPWAMVAYGWQDMPLINQSAALIGSYALSAYLVLAFLYITNYRAPRTVLIGLAIIALPVAYSIIRPEPSDLSVANVAARAVQPNFSANERYDANLAREQLDVQIALSQGDADLVVWPEGSTFVSPSYDPTLIPFLHNALPDKTLILGAPSYDNNLYFNSAYEIRPNGEFYRYDKQHLVPFGDYIPFGDWLLEHGIATQTVTTFSARKGQPRPYPDWSGARPNIMICYEGIFPVMARREGDFIVLITNDIWFGTRSGPYQHLAAARFRAIENGQPLVRSALTGISAIIDANGQILDEFPLGERGFAEAKLGAKYATTLYRRLGDWPFFIAIALGFVALVLRVRRSRISNGSLPKDNEPKRETNFANGDESQ